MKQYTGIDYHKRYSSACTLDEHGHIIREAHIKANAPETFAAYFKSLGGPSQVAMEACWNWGVLYDLLEPLENVSEVVLSNPAKNRIIAESMHKNDRFDARALATLLRGNFISRVHVPSRAVRAKKNVLRQRLWLVRLRTMLRNRIHSLIDRHPRLERPLIKDLFGKKGLAWLKRAKLPAAERLLLDQDLQTHSLLQMHINTLETRLSQLRETNPHARLLQTLPGVGPLLSTLIALEIDIPERFPDSDKLCAYAGLVPTTRASGGKITHGDILPFCNKWLRWAFIEASWTAITCSDYFGALYRSQRARGKQANNAIVITARRMAKIAWQLLHEKRNYTDTSPKRTLSPAALKEH